jgi:hypothetical protein
MELFVKNLTFMAIVTSKIPKRPFKNNSKKQLIILGEDRER